MKRILSILLTLTMVIGLMSGLTLVASAAVDYTANGITGEGTEENPYIIDTAAKFTAIFGVNNSDTASYDEGVYYKITENLTIDGHKSNSMIFRGVLFADENKTIDFGTLADNSRWLNQTQCDEFGITYDNSHRVAYSALFALANGATIKNITLNGTMANSNAHHQGAFAAVAKAITFENCVNNISMPGTSPGANGAVGGFVGAVKDSVSSIINCTNNGAVTGKTAVGGIAGISYGAIAGCINTGNVTGTKSVGGIVGDNYSNAAIEKCSNYGDIKSSDTWAIAGGIVACQRTYGEISKTSNYGDVTCGNGASSYAPGGIIGFVYNYGSAKVTINECMNIGNVTAELATAYPGAIIGDTRSTVEIKNTINLGKVIGGAGQGRVIGSVSGLAANEGFTIASFYDANIENTFGTTATTTSATVIINNSFALSATPDAEPAENAITNVSAATLRGLVSEGTFSSKVWENKVNNAYAYPTLISNPYFIAGPDSLGSTTTVFTSDSGYPMEVGGVSYDNYALIAAKAPELTGFTVKEFGIVIGESGNITLENCKGVFTADADKIIQPSGAFGCLLYNTADMTNGFKKGRDYYVRPYAVYESSYGAELKVYGDAKAFAFEDNN